ncbi:hypothetical protein L2E82_17155 [Cichorium intybus]|uniref:Uncharacterized protein n=1 Tax=Cichorium intybus TaxID=13427 RepID=A0ACB9F7H6_CICIN|nr:hypothetical protein L2E82_17155 [Cichorium intybus]
MIKPNMEEILLIGYSDDLRKSRMGYEHDLTDYYADQGSQKTISYVCLTTRSQEVENEICSNQEEDWEARHAQIKLTKGF